MAFNRIIEITIIPKSGGNNIIIKNLHISFNVEKTITEAVNKGIVRIWNLSENTRSFIKAGDKIIIRAGYEDEGTTNLFFGDIQIVTDSKDSVNRITEIEAYDGQFTLNNKNISISFSAGTPVQSVFSYIINEMELPLSNSAIILLGQYSGGYSFVGKAKDALTQVLAYVGKTWSVQNEQIMIHTGTEPVQRTGLNISPNTGMIGSPESINNKDEKGEEENIQKRWNVKSLLFPQLTPGSLIQITSIIVNGFFTIETVNYEGDNYESDFISEMEVVEIA